MATNAPELEKVTLQLKWLHQFQFAGYYAAQKQGYFKEAGLEVDIQQRNLLENNIQQVIDGQAEYGVSDSILLLYQAKKEPIVIVAPIFQHSPLVLFTLASSGIDSPYALNGKKIAFYQKDTDGFSILAMLAQLDVKPVYDRVMINKNPQVLLSGVVDAYSGYSTNEAFYYAKENIDVNVIRPINYGIDLYGDMLFTNAEEYKNHPGRVERMREAVIKGWQYAMSHKAELAYYIQQHYGVEKSLDHLMYEAKAIENVMELNNTPIGTLDKGRLKFIGDLFLRHGLVDNKVNLEEGVYRVNKEQLQFTQSEKAWIAANPVVKIAVDRHYAPIEFVDEDGNYKGIAAEFLQIISQKTGIRFEPDLQSSWPEAVDKFNQKELDAFPAVIETTERKKLIHFTQPYVKFPMVIATREGTPYIADLKQLKGKVISVVKDYAAYSKIRKTFPNIKLHLVANPKAGLESVANGEAFGYVDNVAVIGHQIQKNGLTNIQIAGEMPFNANISIGIQKDLPELYSIVQKVLQQVSAETYAQLTNKWLQVNYKKRYDWKQLGLILSPILLIMVIILIFNSKLRSTRQRLQVINEKLEVLSVTDHLTGVYNRQYLDQALDAEVDRVQRYQTKFSLIMLDLDNFKAVNDLHGHLIGDEVLIKTAEVIQANIRKTDIFGRWGGEEFLVICTETSSVQVCKLAEKIRLAIELETYPQDIHQTVSLGATQYKAGETVSNCIDQADKNLYEAKARGRNQVYGDSVHCQ